MLEAVPTHVLVFVGILLVSTIYFAFKTPNGDK